MNILIPILTGLAWCISLAFTLYTAYFVVIALCSFKRLNKQQEHAPRHRFAAIIAARNEEEVIGNLVDSLKAQNYPDELYDIIVLPNNCTDRTKQVALEHGATVMESPFPVRSKGDVLTYVFDEVFAHHDVYDAFCVFDADNLVDANFLHAMNNALCNGITVAQGYRDSKNPTDTFTSACYSLYYWAVNRFFNHARSALGLSSIINGSGFMVSAQVLKQNGGWHTVSMTEDIEFTAQCAIANHKIGWVPDAIIYDEQPLTFLQSWKQRRRWSTGIMQTFGAYYRDLLKNGCRKKNFLCFDLLMFTMAPVMQSLSCLVFVLVVCLNLMYVSYLLFPQTDIYYGLFLSIPYSYLATALVAILVTVMERKNVWKMRKGILAFWIFILSWTPINVICLFKKPKVWEQIKHTRSVTISDISSP